MSTKQDEDANHGVLNNLRRYDMEHAKFSPSGSSGWMNCPSWLTGGMASAAAHEGTMCHEIHAECLLKKVPPDTFLGTVREGVVFDQELIDAVTLVVDEVKAMASTMKPIAAHIERKVTLTDDCWGTLDVGFVAPTKACIVDAKYGKGVYVDVKDNSQLLIYAIGYVVAIEKEYEQVKIEEIEIVIIQPRTPNPVRTASYTRTELMDWFKTKLKPALARMEAGVSDCTPGEKQCLWCTRSGCVAQARQALKISERAFAPFTDVDAPQIATSGSPVSELTQEERSELLKHIDFVTTWATKMFRESLDMQLGGKPIPGWKAVYGKANRKWKDTDKDVQVFLESIDIKPFKAAPLKSPAMVETELGKAKVKQVKLENHIVKPKGKPTLVVESDKRPAIEDYADAFAVEEPTVVGIVGSQPVESTPIPPPIPDGLEGLSSLTMDDLKQDVVVVKQVEPLPGESKPANKSTKRFLVYEQGLLGNVTLAEMAEVLGSTVNQVKGHLKYINERDGFGYWIKSDGVFGVFAN